MPLFGREAMKQPDIIIFNPDQWRGDAGPYHSKAVMCRTRTHKYVYRLYEQSELYDLVTDPLEETNSIDNPAFQSALIPLRERLLHWYLETCDVVPCKTDKR